MLYCSFQLLGHPWLEKNRAFTRIYAGVLCFIIIQHKNQYMRIMASSNYTSCHLCSKHGISLVCVKQLYANLRVIVDVSYQIKEFTPSTLRGNYHKPPSVCKQICCRSLQTLLSLSNKGCGPYQWNFCRMKYQRQLEFGVYGLIQSFGTIVWWAQVGNH